MGYIDKETLLWDAAALTVDAVSTNTYDMGSATRDISIGEPLCAVITVDVGADATTGDEAYTFNVIQSANADLSAADIIASRPFTAAMATAGALAAGKQIIIPIPPESCTKRYLGLALDSSGTTPSITVTAWITPQNLIRTSSKYHPKGYTIG